MRLRYGPKKTVGLLAITVATIFFVLSKIENMINPSWLELRAFEIVRWYDSGGLKK